MHVLVLHALDACRSPAHKCMHERHVRLLVMACLLLIYAARPTYNAFISAYAKGDNAEKALRIWVERPLSGRDMDLKISIQTSRRCPSEILISTSHITRLSGGGGGGEGGRMRLIGLMLLIELVSAGVKGGAGVWRA